VPNHDVTVLAAKNADATTLVHIHGPTATGSSSVHIVVNEHSFGPDGVG